MNDRTKLLYTTNPPRFLNILGACLSRHSSNTDIGIDHYSFPGPLQTPRTIRMPFLHLPTFHQGSVVSIAIELQPALRRIVMCVLSSTSLARARGQGPQRQCRSGTAYHRLDRSVMEKWGVGRKTGGYDSDVDLYEAPEDEKRDGVDFIGVCLLAAGNGAHALKVDDEVD